MICAHSTLGKGENLVRRVRSDRQCRGICDTAEFAVESIQRWWTKMGSCRHKQATGTAHYCRWGRQQWPSDEIACGRSHWGAANATGLRIAVCHFPPGTSKWNKIEHRMFSHISMNWRGQPLTSHEVIVNLLPIRRQKRG